MGPIAEFVMYEAKADRDAQVYDTAYVSAFWQGGMALGRERCDAIALAAQKAEIADIPRADYRKARIAKVNRLRMLIGNA